MYLFSLAAFFLFRIDEGKVMSKCHMQAKEKGEEASRWSCKIAACAQAGRFIAVIKIPLSVRKVEFCYTKHRETCCGDTDDETTHRSPDAQCDGTEELSSRRLDAMPRKIAKDLAVHHNPSSEADKVFTIKTMQNVCQTFGVPGGSLGIRDVPSQSSHVKRLHEFLYVGNSVPH